MVRGQETEGSEARRLVRGRRGRETEKEKDEERIEREPEQGRRKGQKGFRSMAEKIEDSGGLGL